MNQDKMHLINKIFNNETIRIQIDIYDTQFLFVVVFMFLCYPFKCYEMELILCLNVLI